MRHGIRRHRPLRNISKAEIMFDAFTLGIITLVLWVYMMYKYITSSPKLAQIFIIIVLIISLFSAIGIIIAIKLIKNKKKYGSIIVRKYKQEPLHTDLAPMLHKNADSYDELRELMAQNPPTGFTIKNPQTEENEEDILDANKNDNIENLIREMFPIVEREFCEKNINDTKHLFTSKCLEMLECEILNYKLHGKSAHRENIQITNIDITQPLESENSLFMIADISFSTIKYNTSDITGKIVDGSKLNPVAGIYSLILVIKDKDEDGNYDFNQIKVDGYTEKDIDERRSTDK